MFGLDTLDLLEPPKPKPRPKLGRRLGLGTAAVALTLIACRDWLPLPSFGPSQGYSGLLLFLTAFAINVFVSIGLGYLAYHASRNRIDR